MRPGQERAALSLDAARETLGAHELVFLTGNPMWLLWGPGSWGRMGKPCVLLGA